MTAESSARERVRLRRQPRRPQAVRLRRRSAEPRRWLGLALLGLLALALAGRAWLAADQPAPAEAAAESTAAAEPAPPAQALETTPTDVRTVTTVRPEPQATSSARSQASSLYELAGQTYGLDPGLLRALHVVESTAATESCPANLEGSGALGPYQFMPATFRAFGRDADGNGRAEICSFPDALFSAAYYLKNLGADNETTSFATYQALRRYGTDPDRVLANLPGGQS
jgi:membrane-bound lytic murein transglycosylase B